MNHELYIQQSLQQFTATITDTAIAELSKQYSGLTINGIDDKEGYKIVRTARLDIKARRVEVDKKRKELNEHALAHQKAVNAEAKRITAMLTTIEDYLANQEFAIDNEIQKIQLQAEIEKQEKFRNRIHRLYALDVRHNPIMNLYENEIGLHLNNASISELSDHAFDDVIKKLTEHFNEQLAIKEKLVEQKLIEERAIRLESERLEKERLAQQAEYKRLEALAKAQEEKELAIRREERRLVHERLELEKAEADRIKHLENLEIARKKEIEEQKLKEEQLIKSEKLRVKTINEIRQILINFDEKNLTSDQVLTLIRRLI
jgi:hypothetical protein